MLPESNKMMMRDCYNGIVHSLHTAAWATIPCRLL